MGGPSSLMRWLSSWPVLRQVVTGDHAGRGEAARSPRQADVRPRTELADRVVSSVCPYCAVGCGQRVFVRDEQIIHIEGHPDSPISRGRLCPKGSATRSLVTAPSRLTHGPLPPPLRHGVGGPPARPGDGHDRGSGHRQPPPVLGGPRRRRPAACAGRWDSRPSAAPRSTTRRTTSSRSSSRRWAPSRSRTRRAYDIPRPSPVWGPRSGEVAPPPSSRTCSTLT